MTQRVALPFFGHDPLPWARPGLSIGGSGNNFTEWLNQNDSTAGEPKIAVAVDGADGLPLAIRAGMDTTNYCITGLMRPIGSPPWTITSAFAVFANHNGGGFGVPIFLYDGTKIHSLYWGVTTGVILGVKIGEWSSITPGSTGATLLGNDGAAFMINDYFAWFRVVNNGSTIRYLISPDGFQFEEIYSEGVNDFLGAVTHVGFGVDRLVNGAGAPVPLPVVNGILWGWIET